MHRKAVVMAIVLVALVSANCSDPPLPEPTATPETFGEWLKGEELEWYTRIPSSTRRDVEFYYSVLGYDQTFAWLTDSVRRLDDGSYSAAWLPDLMAPLSPIEESLTDVELAKLRRLDDRLYKVFVDEWDLGATIHAPDVEPLDRKVYVANRVDEESRRLRKGLDSMPTEIPPIEDLVQADGLKVYNTLDPFWQERFLEAVARSYVNGQVSESMLPSLGDWETKNTFNQLVLQYEQHTRH